LTFKQLLTFCDRTNAVRFDLLDEYATLVPFGLGSPRPKKVVQYTIETDNVVERGVIASCACRLKLLLKVVAVRATRSAASLRHRRHLRTNDRQSAPKPTLHPTFDVGNVGKAEAD